MFSNFEICQPGHFAKVPKYFELAYGFYLDILRDSINILVESGGLIKVFGKNFYNYLIIDAQKLFRLLDKIKGGDVTEEHIEEFKECIEYVGKGLKDRKMDHVREGKRVYLGEQLKIHPKYNSMLCSWDDGSGVICLQLFGESGHYEALCKEFALIEAIGLYNLTNLNRGTSYGDMKENWNSTEINNFGNLILFRALKLCCIDRPLEIYLHDVFFMEFL